LNARAARRICVQRSLNRCGSMADEVPGQVALTVAPVNHILRHAITAYVVEHAG